MTGVFMKRGNLGTETDMHTGEISCEQEETELMHLQAKEY